MEIKHDVSLCRRAFVWVLTLNPKTCKVTKSSFPVGIIRGHSIEEKLEGAKALCSKHPLQTIYLTRCYAKTAQAITKIMDKNQFDGSAFPVAYQIYFDRCKRRRKLKCHSQKRKPNSKNKAISSKTKPNAPAVAPTLNGG
jgi:hypothetical protein